MLDRPRVPDLTDDDKRAPVALLTRAISDDRFPMLRVVCAPRTSPRGLGPGLRHVAGKQKYPPKPIRQRQSFEVSFGEDKPR